MTLNAIYDLECSPVSYDFVLFLCMAKMAANISGCDHVHVVFVPANNETGFRIDNKPTSTSNKVFRLHNLLVQLCHIINASYTICHSRDMAEQFCSGAIWPENCTLTAPRHAYTYKQLARMSEITPLAKFTVDKESARFVKEWTKSEPYLTITLRRTYGKARNSNDDEWRKFKSWAEMPPRNWRVVLIPDTEHAGVWWHNGPGNLGAVNPIIRHALYAGATMNLGVSSGPMALCHYGGLPYLTFNIIADYYSSTAEFFSRYMFAVGSQYPWATDRQRLIYEPDTYETIRTAFMDVMAKKKNAA